MLFFILETCFYSPSRSLYYYRLLALHPLLSTVHQRYSIGEMINLVFLLFCFCPVPTLLPSCSHPLPIQFHYQPGTSTGWEQNRNAIGTGWEQERIKTGFRNI